MAMTQKELASRPPLGTGQDAERSIAESCGGVETAVREAESGVPPALRRRAFTLIELLCVLAIMALLVGMVLTALPRKGDAAAVELAAEQVCAVLQQARNTAIATQASISVVFNIQNAPGSTGRVINNRSGDHWCRILGKTRKQQLNVSRKSFDMPPFLATSSADPYWTATNPAFNHVNPLMGSVQAGPTAAAAYDDYQSWFQWPTFPHLLEEIRADWISPPYTLPRGKVRFLALGDSDEGPRLYAGALSSPPTYTSTVGVNFGYGTTYPRPYFGWYDPASRRLYPWGGYDPNLPAVANIPGYGTSVSETTSTYSGLCYQAPSEPAIPDSRNPEDHAYGKAEFNAGAWYTTLQTDHWPSLVRDTGPLPNDTYYLRRQGAPRALVDGNWGDFAIVFEADGTAWFPPMKCNRRWYAQGGLPSKGVCGPKPAVKGASRTTYLLSNFRTSGNDLNAIAPNGESIHYQRHTNRAYITLAPDSPDDRDIFESAKQALRSLTPMFRVFVSTSGVIGYVPVREDDGVLAAYTAQGWTPWPADPAVYAMETSNRDLIDFNFRYGWLHQKQSAFTGNYSGYWELVPRGMPITDRVSAEMMIRRIWWLDK
jgi:prepilin-type N-terminal cleavage/methylation domain-containing protein